MFSCTNIRTHNVAIAPFSRLPETSSLDCSFVDSLVDYCFLLLELKTKRTADSKSGQRRTHLRTCIQLASYIRTLPQPKLAAGNVEKQNNAKNKPNF